MRILILSTVLFLCASGPLFSQSLIINTIVGSNSYSVSEINKMTYSNDSLHIYLNTNSKDSYPLSEIKNHTFTSGSSGINSISSSNYIKVFPNPTNNLINIQYNLTLQKSTCVEFSDISGRKIFKSPYMECQNGILETQFDINSILKNYKGLIFVKIIDEGGLLLFSEKVSII
jgi:hypothetical protein